MTLGTRLKDARKAAGLTQAAVAERLSVTRPAVTQWERDATVPELDNLKGLAELYGTTVSALISGSAATDRISRAIAALQDLDDEGQEWHVQAIEREAKKKRGGA